MISMPTIPRRWPAEVESDREGALQAAHEASGQLQRAQELLDSTRLKVNTNQTLAVVLLTDTGRFLADALTRMERVQRHLAVAKATPFEGRWPMVVSKQRDEAEESARLAAELLTQAQHSVLEVRSKVQTNVALSEAILADIAQLQARAMTQVERMFRLLTEAGIGRD